MSLRVEWVELSERNIIAVFGDNVTGRRYQAQVLFTTIGTGAQWSAPATYGMQVGAKL